MHQHPPPSQKLGNSHTEHQTNEFVNCVRVLNPNFSFQYLFAIQLGHAPAVYAASIWARPPNYLW
jgi:hypothetical protein